MLGATIIARNYLAQAQVLADSFVAHHPGARFVVLLVDGGEDDRGLFGDRVVTEGPGVEVVLPGDLGLPPGEWEQMAGVYTVLELATAIKAAFLRFLLAQAPAPGLPHAAVYLDPDIVVFQPFPDLFAAAEQHGVVLTPHVLEGLPRDGLLPDERALMHAGLFNLGFLGVGPGALPFLDWWHERLRLDAVVDVGNALFTDQRWVDWVPSLFSAEVRRDPGLNVAYWNLHERPLTRVAGGPVRAGGEPLRFFHFSGFDPDRPWVLSKHAEARPRCELASHPVAAELCHRYGEALRARGFDDHRRVGYGLAATGRGLRLTPEVRAAYRQAVVAALDSATTAPPSPFAADGGEAFARWLLTPAPWFSPWQLEVWRQRADLRAAYPDPQGADRAGLAGWFAADPHARRQREDLGVPMPDDHPGPAGEPAIIRLTPGARTSSAMTPGATDPVEPFGWNVVGYFSAETGVGEAGRRMNLAIEGAGLPTQLVAVPAPEARQQQRLRRSLRHQRRFADSLFCVNADQTERVVALTAANRPADHGRRIGLWFWEVDRFPAQRWSGAFDVLDEIWCASPYSAAAIAAVSPIPVHVVPLPVWTPSRPTPFARWQLGLPDGYVFLYSYSFDSVFERKNPLDLIEAYKRAFDPADGAWLVLKSVNGARHPGELEQVRAATGGRPDILVGDGYLDAAEMQGLIEHCNCFVSLHRSEGFGLHLATAMAAGRPVIATGYSGNLAFMDEDSAFLVPYELVPVGAGNDPYPPAAHWAAPDLEVAARLMRRVFEDPYAAARVGERGRRSVLDRHGLDRAVADIGTRLMGWDRPPARPAVPVQSAVGAALVPGG